MWAASRRICVTDIWTAAAAARMLNYKDHVSLSHFALGNKYQRTFLHVRSAPIAHTCWNTKYADRCVLLTLYLFASFSMDSNRRGEKKQQHNPSIRNNSTESHAHIGNNNFWFSALRIMEGKTIFEKMCWRWLRRCIVYVRDSVSENSNRNTRSSTMMPMLWILSRKMNASDEWRA